MESIKPIGFILQRINIFIPKVKDLLQELYVLKSEIEIAQKTLIFLQQKKLQFFDCTVGDCKCQTRTAFILSLFHDYINTHLQFKKLNNELNQVKQNLENKILEIKQYNQVQVQALTRYLHKITFKDYLSEQNITLHLHPLIKTTSLCLITSLQNHTKEIFKKNSISNKKINKLLVFAKKELCKLSLQYEHNLSQKFCSLDIQKSLEQIETKGICTMTSFFPSFKPIFAKMKALQETFIKKTTVFCLCGGVQNDEFEVFNSNKKKFIPISSQDIDLEQPSMIIYGFQFPGSFNTLKKLLNLPAHEMSIPKYAQTPCQCTITNQSSPALPNIEEAILANFAQHPQFTSNAQIDFEGLGLINSELHKEYKYLKTLSGYSMDDMSKFCIDHIYPSTIQDALNNDSPSIITPKTTHIHTSQPQATLEKVI